MMSRDTEMNSFMFPPLIFPIYSFRRVLNSDMKR